MNLITDTWRGLVRRKLWPVALLLVAALVAVPLTLAKTPEVTVAPTPANAVASTDDGITATYVTSAAEEEATDEESGKRRRTLGKVKDPFEPAPLPKSKKKSTKKASSDASSEKDSTTTSDSGSTGGTTAPTEPVATPEPTATPIPAPANSIRVRFSRTEETGSEVGEPRTVERLEVLPDEEHPVLVYRGVENNGKVAIFELTGNVTVEGDGACEPTPENCQYLKLRAKETVFITVTDTGEDTDAQYQLDLVKINAKSKASASKLKKKQDAGTAVLSELKRAPGYAFDPITGTLDKLSAKAAKRLSLAARKAAL